jgi:hypothetical protein
MKRGCRQIMRVHRGLQAAEDRFAQPVPARLAPAQDDRIAAEQMLDMAVHECPARAHIPPGCDT